MSRPETKQIEVPKSEPDPMVLGLTIDTKFIVRIGIGLATGDYDVAFATIYAPEQPRYGASPQAEPVYKIASTVEVWLTGLERALAERRGKFTEEKMYSLLLERAESTARELIAISRYGSPFPQMSPIAITASDFS